MINVSRIFLLLPLLVLFAGCAAMQSDRADAKRLGTAGQAATQSLQQQAAQVKSSLTSLSTTITVKEILDCRGVVNQAMREGCIKNASTVVSQFEKQRKDLLDIIDKRQKALKALNDAYATFGDLSNYDAGQNTATAVENAFGKINTLSASLGAILPAGVVIAPITATITKALGGLGALTADQRQSELTKAASKDLHTALDAMIKVLQNEEDSVAMKSLMVELQDEMDRMEKSTLEAGLGSTMGILGSFYSKVAPDITLTSSTAPSNSDLATAAAKQILAQTMSSREHSLESAYDQAISVLVAVRTEHEKLEATQGVNVSLIIAEVQHLRDITKTLGN